MSIQISLEEARNYMISYHNLDGSRSLQGESGVLDYVKKVGCLQYDPLNVVGRNPDLVLQSRIKDYNSDLLNELLYQDRTLIDGWDKMMAIYETIAYPYFKRIRDEKEKEMKYVLERRGSIKALDYMDDIRKMIEESGPLQSNKVAIGEGTSNSWGHKKLSSATLDFMFQIGELGIYSKRNTQKIYDLNNRLLPHEIFYASEPFENEVDFYKWYVKRRIGGVGLLWNKSGGGWLGYFISNKKLRDVIIPDLVNEGELLAINVEGIKEPFYIRSEDEAYLYEKYSNQDKRMNQDKRINQGKKMNQDNQISKEARFLAPLDNMLWDRDLIKKIFHFDYSWEVYVPESKRKYGYYVLPVLYGNQLVGRFEPELQRNNEPLKIKHWWWEKDIIVTEEMKTAIIKEFKIFSKYLGAEEIEFDFKDSLLT